MPETTDFGYERIRPEDKASRVGAVFDSVAEHWLPFVRRTLGRIDVSRPARER